MHIRRTAYELARSQVETPHDIVRFVWKLAEKHRPRFERVLDFGAGDGRFSSFGHYDEYHGVEIDPIRLKGKSLPKNAQMHIGCAFNYTQSNYSLCIGNPPYVRHHDLNEVWRDGIVRRLSKTIGININRKSNLYLYFMALGLLKTNDEGLVSLVVPYEWASRPSAAFLRHFIHLNRWHVDIYRFSDDVFGNVLTTTSVSVIDKRKRDNKWHYYDVDTNQKIHKRHEVTLSGRRLLPYESRGVIWALRGMSPGTQKVFTLTEGERLHAGLSRQDVLPCVTTLRALPESITKLSISVFRRWFVDAGQRCWLIKSHKNLSISLRDYLNHVPKSLRETWTCSSRKTWYHYDLHPRPFLLVATGFIARGPKVLMNQAGAFAVGSVCGVHSRSRDLDLVRLSQYIRGINFEKRIVAHSGCLKKIEIRQLNAVLNRFAARYSHE